MIKNKRGSGLIILFFLGLFLVLILGVVGALFISIFKYSSNTITPIMENLGVVGGANLSQAGEVTFGTLDTVVNISSWLLGFAYVMAILGSFMFAIGYSMNARPIFVALYIAFILLLIVFSIIVSNLYQNLYTGSGIIAQGLQDQTLLSYMILYSPAVMVIIAFLTGIFLFAVRSGSEGVGGGGDV